MVPPDVTWRQIWAVTWEDMHRPADATGTVALRADRSHGPYVSGGRLDRTVFGAVDGLVTNVRRRGHRRCSLPGPSGEHDRPVRGPLARRPSRSRSLGDGYPGLGRTRCRHSALLSGFARTRSMPCRAGRSVHFQRRRQSCRITAMRGYGRASGRREVRTVWHAEMAMRVGEWAESGMAAPTGSLA
jgi:hypothetical protein